MKEKLVKIRVEFFGQVFFFMKLYEVCMFYYDCFVQMFVGSFIDVYMYMVVSFFLNI